MYGEAFYGRHIAQHKTLYEFVKYQPVRGWVTQPTFIFIYLPNARSIQVNNVFLIKPIHQWSFKLILKKIGVGHRNRLIGTTPLKIGS